MDRAFVLVHSPLVGQYTWMPAAAELGRQGFATIVPSLLAVLEGGAPFHAAIAGCVARAVARSDPGGPLILVAHSAAGAYLPTIRAGLERPVSGYVFVDARLPQDGLSLLDDSPADFAAQLRAMARAGWLPPWSEWFGGEAMGEVIPDDVARGRFLGELRRIPLALFQERIPVPGAWPDAPCGYLRLSEAYAPEAEQARAWGWPVVELAAQHLHMLVDPPAVVRAILELVGER
jgi:hypothetical protein